MAQYKEYKLEGKVIGYLIEGRYRTHRESSKHFYVKAKGYPISNVVLLDLKANDCKEILVIENRADKSQKGYISDINDWFSCEIFQEEGYDAQRCLSLARQHEV